MRKAVLPFVLSIGLIAVWAAPADAASTRTEYVAQAEAICAKPIPQFIKLDQQVLKLRKRHDLRPSQYAVRLGKIMGKLANIEGGILTQLGTLTPAPGDEATVASWLQGEQQSKGLLDRAAQAGKHGKLGQMIGLLNQALSAAGQADQIVAGFGFRSCVFG
jgi:hypothetical protein